MIDDEQNFADLPQAEHTLLWAMRVWVVGHCRQQDVSDRIGNALRSHGAEGAFRYLEGFMWALSRGVRRPLDAFSLLQRDEADEAEALLGRLITDHAASVAIRSAESMAQEFVGAGLVLRWTPAAYEPLRVADQARVLH